MTVDEAYAYCRRMTHRYGGNFSVGFRFLPDQKQRAVYAAYAFCRWADDLADEPVMPIGTPGAEPQKNGDIPERLEALNAWQRELDATYEGRPSHPITIALADALKTFPIPKSAFVALIDGCRLDLVKTRYETFDELVHYCDLVATSISDISLSIFGFKTPEAFVYGRKLATALQLTNVTRDIGDDLTRDRVYLPQEELRRFGVEERELFERAESARMLELVKFEIDRAESYFRAAEPLLQELSFDARFPVLLMGGVYATVLGKLKHDPLIVIRRRLSLSTLQKMLVVGKRMLRPHFV
jgi:15-cis-phytoene synthase